MPKPPGAATEQAMAPKAAVEERADGELARAVAAAKGPPLATASSSAKRTCLLRGGGDGSATTTSLSSLSWCLRSSNSGRSESDCCCEARRLSRRRFLLRRSAPHNGRFLRRQSGSGSSDPSPPSPSLARAAEVLRCSEVHRLLPPPRPSAGRPAATAHGPPGRPRPSGWSTPPCKRLPR